MALHCACDTTTSKKWRGQTFFARCFSSVSTSSDRDAPVVLVAWEHRNIPLLAEALGYSDSNPEFKQELEKCHSKLGGWPTDADFDFVYTFSYDTGSDRLVGFSCRHEGVTPFIPADAYGNCNKHDDC